MLMTALSILLVIVFLMMNAFFVVAEFALVRVRRSQLDLAVAEGRKGAKAAVDVCSNINAYLSACQLGITLASLAIGWLGEPAVSAVLEDPLVALGLPEAAVHPVCVAVGFILITALHVVVGELIPKSFAIFSTEKYALFTAGPLRMFYRITYPIMVVFNGITNWVVKLFGHDPANEHEVYTGDEAIMTPRTEVICLDLQDTLQENLDLTRQYKYTRYPVCNGSKDHIVGFVQIKDLLLMPADTPMSEWNIRELPAVPETMPIARVLQELQEQRTKICLVVDEHGGTAGIVTMSDVIQQIVGHIDDEYRHESADEVTKLPDGGYEIDGSLPIGDVVELIGFEPVEADECETAAGLIMALFDRIPSVGESVEVEEESPHMEGDEMVRSRVTFTVEAMDRHRITRILVR